MLPQINFTMENCFTNPYEERVYECRKTIQTVFAKELLGPNTLPEFVVVLGTSGPKGLLTIEGVEIKKSVSYKDIGLPVPSAEGHSGMLHYAMVGGKPVFICQGRIHYFEGYTMDDITLLDRALATMEIENFILTNASGTLNTHFQRGNIAVITDHINNMGDSPLRGRSFFHGRFLSQENNYDEGLRKLTYAQAKALDISELLNKNKRSTCVYTAVVGPEFETSAEVQKFSNQAHLIGMSTVPSVLALRQLDRRVLALSLITNYGTGLSDTVVSHEGNLEEVEKKDKIFSALIYFIIEKYK